MIHPQHTPPEGYEKLPDGVRCRCVHLWQFGEDYFCCKQKAKPISSRKLIDLLDDPRVAAAVNEKGGGRWS